MSNHLKQDTSVKLYIRLLSYVKRYWPAFILAIIGNILYSSVDASFTYMLKPVLNKGFIARDLHFIKFLPFLIIGVFILRGIANFLSSYFMSTVSRGVIMHFRQEILAKLIKLPASYYDNTSSGQILSVIIFNVAQVSNSSADALTNFLQSFFLIIGLLIVMFSISWKLSVFYLVTIPLIAFAVKASSRRIRQISKSIQDKMGEVTSIAEEAIEGYKVVRSFGGQEYEMNKFNSATNRNRLRELKMVVTKTLTVSGVQLIAAVALSITVYLATSHSGSTVLSAGGFVSFVAAMLALLKPLKNLTTVNATIQRGLAGAQSIFELLDEEEEKDLGTITVERVKGEIKFDHVDFVYPGHEKQVLRDINLHVKAGQMIALVGRSGGGKTTLVNLLPRFYDGIQNGSITIDGIDIREFKLAELRKQFAYVSQQVTLFNDTVAHNIAYGRFENASEAEIISAAKAANAWGFIEQLPDGLQTVVGEDGVLLSGGQRQRIAIARAILKNAPILILDEATSALDTESERQIQDALDELMHHRTSFVIAHRLSTIEHADKILVIEQGEILETGTHQSLLEKDGRYAKLYKMQFKDR